MSAPEQVIPCGKLYAGGAPPVLACLLPRGHDEGPEPTPHRHIDAEWRDYPPKGKQ